MKRNAWIVVVAGFVLAALPFVFGQVAAKLTTEPDPSFAEDAVSNHRHPEVDTDVFLYINHWRNSLPYEGHGGFIERDILTPGDPLHPPKKGAVLKYLKAYKRAALEPRCSTKSFKSDKEQVFLCVFSGQGRVEAGGQAAEIEPGMAVFLPAGLSYRFLNPHETNLELIMVVEDIPAGFVPNTKISVGDYRKTLPSVGMHWAHIGRGFEWDTPPKFANPVGFAAVSIDKFDIAQPHVHGAGCEEVWCQLQGTSLLLFGSRLLKQEPGEAFLVPPNRKVPHSSINPTDEPMLWLYMGNRHDNVR
ncbi:MAG TPA: cupin domain-containing protein [Acidobacteriota bacterium]|nr:cupin domain-containing protein [Acidobacteriota bacterium]